MNHHLMQFSAMEQKQISFEESNWMDDIYVFLVAIQQQTMYSLKHAYIGSKRQNI